MMEEAGLKDGDGEREGEQLQLRNFVVGSLPTIIYIPNFVTQPEQAQLLHQIYEVSSSRWKSLKNRRLQNWGGVVHEKGLLPQDSSNFHCGACDKAEELLKGRETLQIDSYDVFILLGSCPGEPCVGKVPPWLNKLTKRICEQTGLFPSAINHVLINEYMPDQGIMPHQDGPAYFPVVAILSLQSPLVIDFTLHPRLKEFTKKVPAEDQGTDETKFGVGANGPSDELTSREDVDQQPNSVLLMPCSLLIFKDQAYSDYLHGIQDSDVHRLDKVLNVSEIKKLREMNLVGGSGSASEVDLSEGLKSASFRRTTTRVSLTCRLVLKVHKKLFKF